jgi:hypothetical protein
MRVFTFALLCGSASLLVECLTKECTAVGCADGASVTVRSADGSWADGQYSLTITVDGRVHICDTALPQDLATQPGQVTTLTCTPALSAVVLPEVTCTETRNGDGVSQSCVPIAGRRFFTIDVPATPSQLEVVMQRDGTELLRETRTLKYEEVYPNGPECGPACRQAAVTLTTAQ